MKDLNIPVGFSNRLEGLVGGNITVVNDTFVTPESGGPRERQLTKVTIERADIDDFVIGVFKFLPPDQARALLRKLRA
jgi:hypothetical protein